MQTVRSADWLTTDVAHFGTTDARHVTAPVRSDESVIAPMTTPYDGFGHCRLNVRSEFVRLVFVRFRAGERNVAESTAPAEENKSARVDGEFKK